MGCCQDGFTGGGGGGGGLTGVLTPGVLPVATAPSVLGDSIARQAGGVFIVTGNLSVSGLAGVGTRILGVTAAGVIVPVAGVPSGAGAVNEVAVWGSATNIGSYAAFTFNGATLGVTGTLAVAGAATVSTTLTVTGNTRVIANLGVGGVPGTDFHVGKAINGGTVQGWVENTSNTVNSDAKFAVITGGATGGDPYYTAEISGGQKYAWGADKSDSSAWVLSCSALPGTTNAMRVSSAGAVTHPFTLGVTGVITAGSDLNSVVSLPASDISWRLQNTDNTSGSSTARLMIGTGGASSGDPVVRWDITGVTTWVAGPDNSVSGDPWVLAASGALGTSNVLSITTAGVVTLATVVFGAGSPLSNYVTTTFSVTLGGCTTAPAVTVRATRIGDIVQMVIPQAQGISNAANLDFNGFPAAWRPVSGTQEIQGVDVFNNGVQLPGSIIASGGSGIWTLKFKATFTSAYASAFIPTGTKGTATDFSFSYSLQ